VAKSVLQKLPEYFLPVDGGTLSHQGWYYVVYKINTTMYGYLTKLIMVNAEEAWFHHVSDSYLVTSTLQSQETMCTKIKFQDGKLKFKEGIFAVPALSKQKEGQIQETVYPLEKWILEDSSVMRSPVDKMMRASMLSQAVEKAINVIGADPAKWPTEESEIANMFNEHVLEATRSAIEALQLKAQNAASGEEFKAPSFGNLPTNSCIAARTMMRVLEAASEPNKPADRRDSRELTSLSRQVDKLSQQISLMAAGRAKNVEEAKMETTKALLISMKKNGKCCFEAAGAVLELFSNAGTDLAKISEKGAKHVADAKGHLTNNFINLFKKMEDFASEVDGQHFASTQWKEMIGENPDTILNRVKEGKTWGGIVELALALWHTHIEIVVVHAEAIHAKATDDQVQVAVHPAMLKGLPEGPLEKTSRVYVVLENEHYHLAITEQGSSKRAMFAIGKDSDDARDLIVTLLKSKKKGPLGELDEADRREVIAAAFSQPKAGAVRPGVSFAVVTGQHKSSPVADAPKQPGTDVLCRNYENSSICSYGDKCRFLHDDSRKGRNRQNKNRKRTKLADEQKRAEAGKKASRGRSRSPARKGRGNGHDQTGSISDSRSRSASRSRSGSRNHSDRGRDDRSNQQPNQGEWQQAPSRKRQIRVRCRKTVHPAGWRDSLQSINKAAHALVTWVIRDIADEDWLLVQCESSEEEQLAKLLGQSFTIERRRGLNKSSNRRSHHCADFLNGDRCKHPAPYCK
jgi:hypothetical protein